MYQDRGSHMTQIDETIATYLIACAVEGKSVNTVWSYRTSLADFRRVGAKLTLPDVLEAYTVSHVYAFLNDLRLRGASPAYQHRRHREVKAFFSWCKRLELVLENVFARVPLVKLEQQIVQPLLPAEIHALLNDQDRTVHHDCRNYALLLFLLDTGVRAAECVSVRLDDVDWERNRVRVLHGKPCSSGPQVSQKGNRTP
jgi:site-specific recombinase XerD